MGESTFTGRLDVSTCAEILCSCLRATATDLKQQFPLPSTGFLVRPQILMISSRRWLCYSLLTLQESPSCLWSQDINGKNSLFRSGECGKTDSVVDCSCTRYSTFRSMSLAYSKLRHVHHPKDPCYLTLTPCAL